MTTPVRAAWLAKDRERYFSDPVYRAHRRELGRASYNRTRETAAARKKLRYENDPDYRSAVLERAKLRERDRSVRSVKYARKKTRLAGAKVSAVDLKEVLAQANGVCGICGRALDGKVHFDHIVPLARGGSHTKDNLQATHARCNMSKGARLVA